MNKIIIGPILICAGIILFSRCFRKLQQKRLIEDIPTSSIRGLAMGLAEITGQARYHTILHSPLTQTNCVYWKYTIEKHVKRNNSSRWEKIAGGDSSLSPFYVEDHTGKILVLPEGAENIMNADFRHETGPLGTLPANLEKFLMTAGVPYKSLLGIKHRLRFREWVICENDPVYVLGHTRKSSRFIPELQSRVNKNLMAMQSDPAMRSRIDFNRDGRVSEEELKIAGKRIEKALLEKMVQSGETGDVLDVAIAAGPHGETFILSDRSQKELTRALSVQFTWQLLLGAVLAVIGLYLFLDQLSVFDLLSESGLTGKGD